MCRYESFGFVDRVACLLGPMARGEKGLNNPGGDGPRGSECQSIAAGDECTGRRSDRPGRVVEGLLTNREFAGTEEEFCWRNPYQSDSMPSTGCVSRMR
jgi:hypothetical protein